jgi:hypothetical protein
VTTPALIVCSVYKEESSERKEFKTSPVRNWPGKRVSKMRKKPAQRTGKRS